MEPFRVKQVLLKNLGFPLVMLLMECLRGGGGAGGLRIKKFAPVKLKVVSKNKTMSHKLHLHARPCGTKNEFRYHFHLWVLW